MLLDEVSLPPLLALDPLRRGGSCGGGVDVVRGEGGQLRPPAELGAGLAVARRQLGVAPEELAGGGGERRFGWAFRIGTGTVTEFSMQPCTKLNL